MLSIQLGRVLIKPLHTIARFLKGLPVEIKFFVQLCSCRHGARIPCPEGGSVAAPSFERLERPLLMGCASWAALSICDNFLTQYVSSCIFSFNSKIFIIYILPYC